LKFKSTIVEYQTLPTEIRMREDNKKIRPSWNEYFMDITYRVAMRSTCLRRRVGAIVVKDNRILCTGYNGPPTGIEDCWERGGCLRDKLSIPSGQRQDLSRAVCAEMNAIIQAAKYGIRIEDADIYCTTFPCSYCAKMIINVGIKRILYVEGYPDDLSNELLKEALVECIQLDKPD
jgi:dCMP deaminase